MSLWFFSARLAPRDTDARATPTRSSTHSGQGTIRLIKRCSAIQDWRRCVGDAPFRTFPLRHVYVCFQRQAHCFSPPRAQGNNDKGQQRTVTGMFAAAGAGPASDADRYPSRDKGQCTVSGMFAAQGRAREPGPREGGAFFLHRGCVRVRAWARGVSRLVDNTEYRS